MVGPTAGVLLRSALDGDGRRALAELFARRGWNPPDTGPFSWMDWVYEDDEAGWDPGSDEEFNLAAPLLGWRPQAAAGLMAETNVPESHREHASARSLSGRKRRS